jgi:hypothetical protein
MQLPLNEDIMDLDISWIKENEILNNIQEIRTKENMEFIKILYVYINSQSEIIDIVTTKYTFEKGASTIIPKHEFLDLVNQHKNHKNIKYNLFDTLLYNATIDPFHIDDYSNRHENSVDEFFKPISCENDIIIHPSVFIFHEINSLFVFLKEIPFIPKSILKNTTKSFKINNSIALTKKVKISLENPKSNIISFTPLTFSQNKGGGSSRRTHNKTRRTRASNLLSINNIK